MKTSSRIKTSEKMTLAENVRVALLDQTKNDQFSVGGGFRLLGKRLKEMNFQVDVNRGDYSAESLKQCSILIMGDPQDKFTKQEVF